MKIYNVYTSFHKYGGAEKVLLNLHAEFKKIGLDSYVVALNKFENNFSQYEIKADEYLQFGLKSIFSIRGSVIISHHRKITSLLIILNKALALKNRIIHIAHNEFHNLKALTLYPKEIVAVSERVKDNLIDFFEINPKNIHLIYNGLSDEGRTIERKDEERKTRILYPGRITTVKRQLAVVSNLKGKINDHVEIHFAGTGEELNELTAAVEGSDTFKSLGFVDVKALLPEYDYILLFSSKEGLPLTLIEACMFSRPIICNDVGGNAEIVADGYNGYITNDFEKLISICNSLPDRTSPAYVSMALNSREVFLEKFQIDHMVKQYLNLINNGN